MKILASRDNLLINNEFQAFLDGGPLAESSAPVALNGCELEELLSPVSSEEFAESYFARASLKVDGQPDKFDHIFSWAKLRQALLVGQSIQDERFNVTASHAGGEEAGSSKPVFRTQLNQVNQLLKDGATICITNIHMADPSLAAWAQAIRAQLNFSGTVGVNCYVSADGAGLPMHYDKRVATTLQISGKKRWTFSKKAAKPWPDHNAVFKQGRAQPAGIDVGKLPDELEIQEVEMNPGDLLCLPAGAWHAARGIGHSLALNIYFAPRNLFEQLLPLLTDFAVANDEWRGGPPATIEKIQGEMPVSVSAYLTERLEELKSKMLGIMREPDSVSETWLNSLTQSPYTGWQPKPELPLPTATALDRFRIAVTPLRFIQTGNTVKVPHDNGILSFPATLVPILDRLSSAPAGFTVPDVLSWQRECKNAATSEIVAFLQILYKKGILEML